MRWRRPPRPELPGKLRGKGVTKRPATTQFAEPMKGPPEPVEEFEELFAQAGSAAQKDTCARGAHT
eukprot:7846015-Lingulodinium_polyedra.AAC.1